MFQRSAQNASINWSDYRLNSYQDKPNKLSSIKYPKSPNVEITQEKCHFVFVPFELKLVSQLIVFMEKKQADYFSVLARVFPTRFLNPSYSKWIR